MRCLKYFYHIFLSAVIFTFIGCSGKSGSSDTTKNLGKISFPISCNPEIQARFERGLALLHHMMYIQAEKEFASVADIDSDCAMAYWGIAMTQYHPLWAEPNEMELKKGWEAVEKAKTLDAPTPREQSYIAAIETFYKDWNGVDHSTRRAAWEAAQKKVYEENPEDFDAGAFYALAHLATAPKADKTYTQNKEAGLLLEDLRAKSPEHPGLLHYTIHAYDNPILANRALEVARGYDKIAPEVPHALHMPSHIFVRLGLWNETIDWNIRSAAAAKKQPVGEMTSAHYIHAMDYLMYAYLQQGQDKMAQDVLHKINGIENYQDNLASAYGIAAAQARFPLERGQWANAADLQLRTHSSFLWDKYPWNESITYFARGIGAARNGDTDAARETIDMLDTLYKRSVEAGQNYWAIHVDVQRETIAAWIAFSKGKKDLALNKMKEAADLEDSVDKHPVTPGAVLPARELFGEMQLLAGNHADAIKAYESCLEISPNRYNSLYGAGRAAELGGDKSKAALYYGKLIEMTADAGTERASLQQVKAFLDEN